MVSFVQNGSIRIGELSRSFKDLRAIDNISLDIERGNLFGLIGPDGAGKTTLLRILSGILKIDSGEVYIGDCDLVQSPEAAKSIVGYMAQQFGLYDELTVVENLKFYAAIFDVPSRVFHKKRDELLQFAGLAEFSGRRSAHLSGGMQKKLALACCLVHDPEILLLDEPTTGVDPVSRREFWHILGELHLQGKTIVVSTPYMDEADRCSEIGLIYEGKLIQKDDPQKILESLSTEMLVLVTKQTEGISKKLLGLAGVREVQVYGDSYHLLVEDSRKQMKEVSRLLKRERIDVKELYPSIPKMEEAFISLVSRME